jgi:hypothetical protein
MRNKGLSAATVRDWFSRLYDTLNMNGCSSHSGWRTFIIRAAKEVSVVGGSLHDVQQLARHAKSGKVQAGEVKMPRKRKQTKAPKASKRQRRTPSKPSVTSPPQQTPPDIKISEAILTLAEPLRARYRESHRLQAIISIAVMAWNISLFPEAEQAHVQGTLLESLPQQLDGEDVGVLLGTMDALIARKNLLYPNVREYILTHNLSFADHMMTLTVGTAPVPETIQRRS